MPNFQLRAMQQFQRQQPSNGETWQVPFLDGRGWDQVDFYLPIRAFGRTLLERKFFGLVLK
jgi:hypothetical protein